MTEISCAQAIPAALKTGELDLYHGLALTRAGNTNGYAGGITLEAAYLIQPQTFGQLGLAIRYSWVQSQNSQMVAAPKTTESFAGAGIESHYRTGKVSPFVTVLLGVGSNKVTQLGYSGSGRETLLGGGADFPISGSFSIRGEFNYGFLYIPGNNTAQGNLHLMPSTTNIGLVYHFW